MIQFDYKNPEHQSWMVKLALMYYSSGDVKDIYEDEDLEKFKSLFDLKDDNDIWEWLNTHGYLYEDSEYLMIFPDNPPIIFAECTREGEFQGFLELTEVDIISMAEEANDDGTYDLEYVEQGENIGTWFLEYKTIYPGHTI